MTLLAAVAFSPFLLEYNDLFSAKLTDNLTGNLGLGQHWRANFYVALAADKKHIRQDYFFAHVADELFNFNDTWIVVEQNWWLVLLSLALGVWVGWVTCSRENNQAQG